MGHHLHGNRCRRRLRRRRIASGWDGNAGEVIMTNVPETAWNGDDLVGCQQRGPALTRRNAIPVATRDCVADDDPTIDRPPIPTPGRRTIFDLEPARTRSASRRDYICRPRRVVVDRSTVASDSTERLRRRRPIRLDRPGSRRCRSRDSRIPPCPASFCSRDVSKGHQRM